MNKEGLNYVVNIKVSTRDKERFIKWLLLNYKFKALESERILTYLLEDDQLLNLTHFVNDITNCPRAISLSTTTVDEKPLVFYKSNVKSTNGMQAFHDLRLNNNETLYVKINLKECYNQLYYAVLESNSFLLKEDNNNSNHWTSINDELNINLRKQQKYYLQQKIDKALDENNKDDFIRLSNELKKITKV